MVEDARALEEARGEVARLQMLLLHYAHLFLESREHTGTHPHARAEHLEQIPAKLSTLRAAIEASAHTSRQLPALEPPACNGHADAAHDLQAGTAVAPTPPQTPLQQQRGSPGNRGSAPLTAGAVQKELARLRPSTLRPFLRTKHQPRGWLFESDSWTKSLSESLSWSLLLESLSWSPSLGVSLSWSGPLGVTLLERPSWNDTLGVTLLE